jgi:vancomycin permeability regulator SanA
MRQLALDAGVPCANVFVEDQGLSTLQSAMRCTHVMRQHGWSIALIVTDRFHLPRALLTFRSLGVHAVGSAPPGVPYSRKLWKRWCYRVREILAFAWYLLLIPALKMRGFGNSTELM